MPILKYKNPTTQLWEPVICGALGDNNSNGGTASGIPITSEPSDDTTVWIDPNENASEGSNNNLIRIETGSYVGTNTAGINEPNVLVFNFLPKLIFISSGSKTYDGDETVVWGLIDITAKALIRAGDTSYYSNNVDIDTDVVENMYGIRWYSSSTQSQFNFPVTYYYTAIG